MKAKRLIPIVLSLLMVGTLFAGCGGKGDSNTPEPPPSGDTDAPTVTGVVASADKTEANVGDTVNLSAVVNGTNNPSQAVTWEITEGGDFATLNGSTLTLTGEGTVKVVAKSNADSTKKSDVITITINAQQGGGGEASDTSTVFNNKIYLVGDSTVCAFTDSYYLPRYGYGTQIAEYINVPAENVKNYAMSGRSSYSLITDTASNYNTLKSEIKSGDYLIIGFGHNDEKREVARYSDPTLATDDASTMIGTHNAGRPVSFKYILYNYYIKIAEEAGAIPVLCTPITRFDAKNAGYTGSIIHQTETKTDTDTTANPDVTTQFNGGDYSQAIRDLANEKGVALVDLTTITANDYQALGNDVAKNYHAATGASWADESKTSKVPTGIDATHTNKYGAKMNAYHIATELAKTQLSIKASIKTNIVKPTYETEYEGAINQSYVITENRPFNPETDAANTLGSLTASTTDSASQNSYKWYGTNIGNLDPTHISISQGSDANGATFTISVTAGKGKVASGEDQMAAVFIQVPWATAFTVTADVAVTEYGGSQSGFGLMVRDDIAVGKVETIATNYITAGVYGTSSGSPMGFCRNNGTLAKSGTKAPNDSLAGNTYSLSLARTSQSVTANFGTNSYSAVSDFDLAASDSEYVYICLWATRGANVTFSNIHFTSGEWQSA